MKKILLTLSICFLMLVVPNISALQYQSVNEAVQERNVTLIESIKDKINGFGSLRNIVGLISVILSIVFLILSDILTVLGWETLNWTIGLGVLLLVSGGIGALLSIFLLIIGCILCPDMGFQRLIIPFIIALSPVFVPAFIWLLSSIDWDDLIPIINWNGKQKLH